MNTGGLLRGGSNGVFYHAVEAPVESVVRWTSGCIFAKQQEYGVAHRRLPLTEAARSS